jgi:DNA-binding beta-propeller fold protein YncE
MIHRKLLAAIALYAVVTCTVTSATAERHVYVGRHTDGLVDLEGIAMSPDGKNVYVADPFFDFYGGARVPVYARDVTTGLLTAIGALGPMVGTNVVEDVVVSPDGDHVYVAASGDQSILVTGRDSGTGLLTPLEIHDSTTIPGLLPVALAMSADGKSLYVANGFKNTVVVFLRDVMTGQLSYVETHTDDVSGVDGLLNVRSIVVSPDGGHVYAGSQDEDAVAIFSRNSASGALIYDGMVKDGVGGVTGLDAVTGIDVSPDGAYIYATGGGNNDSVVVFSRNDTTGALTFVQNEPTSNFPQGVTVSPDGRHVYVALSGANGLLTFHRDAGTGMLTPDEQFLDGVAGVDGLEDAFNVVVSPDNAHVYVTAQEGAVSIFRRMPFACTAAPVGSCFQPSQPGKGKLVIRDNVNDAMDKIVWKWLRGEELAVDDFGDPIGTFNDYALCLYDASGGGQLLAELLAPARVGCQRPQDAGALPCWKSISTVGLKYVRKSRHPDGVLPVKLLSGAAGFSKALVRAKGEGVPMPALPLTPPVTVQLQNADGKCWEATFSTPSANDAAMFKATAD